MHAAPGRAVQHAARVKSVVSTSNNVYNMQVLEVPLMVNPSQDEALATQTMAQKGSGKSVTLQQAFCSRTSLHCE